MQIISSEHDPEEKRLINNIRTSDITQFIDCDLWLGELDENDQIVEGSGEWVPHTILADDQRFQSILDNAVNEPEQIPIIRNIYARLDEALRKGTPWNGHRLVAHDTVHRQRILSAATRMTINGTLPKDKQVLDYPIVGGGMVDIPKDQVVSVSLLIQDYTEDCQDNFMRLIQDETLDQFSGWPE